MFQVESNPVFPDRGHALPRTPPHPSIHTCVIIYPPTLSIQGEDVNVSASADEDESGLDQFEDDGFLVDEPEEAEETRTKKDKVLNPRPILNPIYFFISTSIVSSIFIAHELILASTIKQKQNEQTSSRSHLRLSHLLFPPPPRTRSESGARSTRSTPPTRKTTRSLVSRTRNASAVRARRTTRTWWPKTPPSSPPVCSTTTTPAPVSRTKSKPT